MGSQNTFLAGSMRAAPLVYLTLVVLSYLGRAEDQGTAMHEVLELMHQVFGGDLSTAERKAKIRLLDTTQIEKVRNEIYRRLQNPLSWEGGQPDQSYIDELMLIGDDWARDVVAARFRTHPHNAWLNWTTYRDPKLIARVGDMLLLNDVVTQEDYEAGYGGRQSWTAPILLDTLGNSPAFNADVINWARRLQDARSRETVAIMREWWKANETVLKANDFKAVQPGRSLPEERAPEPAIVPTLVANSASPNAVASTPVAPAAEPSTPSTATLWTCAAAAIALLVSLVVFWKRRV